MTIRKSSIISGQKALQTYERNGLEIGTEPIKEYVRLIAYDVDKTSRLMTIPENLRFIAMIGTVNERNRVTFKVNNPRGEFLYTVEVNTAYFTYNSLIVEQGSTIEFSSNNVVSFFTIFASQCAILYDLSF